MERPTPPHNNEIEQAFLCALLKGCESFEAVTKGIEPGDFYTRAHQRIYEALLHLHETGIEIEPLSLITTLKQAGKLDEAGREEYVKTLCDAVPSNANLDYYSSVTLDYSRRRALLRIASEIGVAAYDETKDVNRFIKKVAKNLRGIKKRVKGKHNG